MVIVPAPGNVHLSTDSTQEEIRDAAWYDWTGAHGSNMTQRLMKHGHECVVHDTRAESMVDLQQQGAKGTTSLEEFVSLLARPRAIWLMLPAAVVDTVLAKLVPLLRQG